MMKSIKRQDVNITAHPYAHLCIVASCWDYSCVGQLRLLYRSYRYFTDRIDSWILQLKLELQLVGNRVIGIKIYRTQIPAFMSKQRKENQSILCCAYITTLLVISIQWLFRKPIIRRIVGTVG